MVTAVSAVFMAVSLFAFASFAVDTAVAEFDSAVVIRSFHEFTTVVKEVT